MMLDASFETERLAYRPWRRDDGGEFLALYGDPEVVRYIGFPPLTTRAEAVRRLGELEERYRSLGHPFGSFRVSQRSDDALVGTAILKPVPWSFGIAAPSDVEVGWHLVTARRGHGYATEAGGEMIRRGFAELPHVAELIAVVEPPNAASRAVAERLGMAPRGRTRRYYDIEADVLVAARGG